MLFDQKFLTREALYMKMRLLKTSALILAFLAVSLMALIPAGILRADGESTIKPGQTKSVDLKSDRVWWYKYRAAEGKMLELKSTGSTNVVAALYDSTKNNQLVYSNRDENGVYGNVRIAWYCEADTDYYFKVYTVTSDAPVSSDNDTKITMNDITDNTVVTKIDEAHFPDQYFRERVARYDFRHDGKLYKDVVREITSISGLSAVSDYTGIEYFTELRSLNCFNNQKILSLDLSKNTKLQNIDCSLCINLSSLNVLNCKNLSEIKCYHTAITSLDLKDCKGLVYLECHNCNIGSLDLNGCSQLTTLQCYQNKLVSLNLKGCMNLITVDCAFNPDLESIDVSDGIYLDRLSCNSCKISSLKLNKKLSDLNCYSNALKSLDLSGCSKLMKLVCYDNDLSYIDIGDCPWIQAVYDSKYWKADPGQYETKLNNKTCLFRFDSGLPVAGKSFTSEDVVEINEKNFPDANFRTVVSRYDLDGNGWFSNSEIKLISELDLYYKQVEKVDGIKYFTELESLTCNNNKIKQLDLSANKKLDRLLCSENEITKIILPKDSKLQVFGCSKNNLKSLDISGCKDLVSFDCSSNKLTALDVSKNTKLKYLIVYANQLPDLDVSSNTDLDFLAISNNKIKEIDISGNKTLIRQYQEGEKKDHVLGGTPCFYYSTQFSGYMGLIVDPDMKIITEKIISLTLDKKEANIVCGSTLTLKATLKNSTSAISWKSSNTKIATVDSKGKITSKMAGKVTITATAAGKTAKCTVTVLYKDVTNSSDFWYAPTNYLTAKGVVKGYANQTEFRPTNDCTRAQMVTFLYRLQGEPKTKSNECKFDDVKSGDYFYKPVIWAVEQGITTGVSKTSFNPQGVCTRAQTVTFLWRMAGKPEPAKNAKKFTDVETKDYFYKATLWASGKKILAGYDDNTFRPQGKCLRRQMVTFLYKYDKYINEKG